MSKQYKIKEQAPTEVAEPAVAYKGASVESSLSEDRWNSNVPFHGTQEEWWEHFHQIEQGIFYPVSETHQRILKWLKHQEM